MSKELLRKKLIQQRLLLDEDTRQMAADALAERVITYIKNRSEKAEPAVIASYIAHRGEIDTMPLMQQVSALDITLALPCMANGKVLAFRKWFFGAPLTKADFGIKQPAESAEILNPDIVLVPLVGVDKELHRLGYGGGFYDATLANLKNENKQVVAIGLAYDFQLVDMLPHEAHDYPLDRIVTPTKWISK